MRVLVVEDDADLAEILKFSLVDEGWEVTTTASGLEGLLELARSRYDACLVDLEVEALSGLGVQRAVRDFSTVPAIVMSTSMSGWQADAFAAGATACLKKPFDLTDLIALVDAISSTRRPPQPWWGDVRRLAADDCERISRLSPEQLDELPFGAIRLAPDGRVTAFNSYESEAAHLPASHVVGRRFADIAPCSTVKHFTNVAREAFATRSADRVLRLIFPHHSAWVLMSVRLYFDPVRDELWVFTSKRQGQPLGVSERDLQESLAFTPAPLDRVH